MLQYTGARLGEVVIEDEIARREQRKLATRQRHAGINTQKTLESYDFTFNLGVN